MSRWRRAWRAAAPYAVPAGVFLLFLLIVFWRLWTPIDGARRAFGWDAQWEYWGDLQFQVESLRAGELPLWNPFDRGGYPFHGDPQTGWLYPASWPLVIGALIAGATPWWLIAVKIVFHFWLACMGLYFFLRRRGNPIAACYAGPLIYVLSYPYLHNVFSALNWNMAWAPWALLAVDWWAEKPGYARGAWVALALSMCALAGGPASFWYALLVVGPYGAWAVWHHALEADDRRAYLKRAAITAAVAGAIFGAMVIAQFSSTAQLVQQSVRGSRDFAFITTTTFGIDDLAAFLIPRMIGGNTYLGYASIVWIAVVLTAFPNPRNLVLAAIAVLGVLCSFGDTGDFLASQASLIPPFGFFRRAHRYLYVTQLAVAILGAEGLAAVIRDGGESGRRRIRGAVLVAGGLGVLIFGVGFVVQAQPDLAAQPLRDAFALACVATLVTTWVTYMILRHTGSMQRRFIWIAVVALGADLWFAHGGDVEVRMHPVPRTQRDEIVKTFEDVPLGVRVYDRLYLKFRPGIRMQIRDYGGYEGDPLALARYNLLLERVSQAPRHMGHVNIGYLLERGQKKLRKNAADHEVLDELGPGAFRVTNAAPAVIWTGTAQVVDSAKEAAGALLRSQPGTTAVLERRYLDDEQIAWAEAKQPRPPAVAGAIVAYARNRMAAEVTAPEAGVVVIHESYFPHWSATVDGEPARIVPVNVQFRGVFVGPGAHRIEMVYEPPWYGLLALLNPLGLLAAFGLIVFERRRARSS